jgi:hypothetical protein
VGLAHVAHDHRSQPDLSGPGIDLGNLRLSDVMIF